MTTDTITTIPGFRSQRAPIRGIPPAPTISTPRSPEETAKELDKRAAELAGRIAKPDETGFTEARPLDDTYSDAPFPREVFPTWLDEFTEAAAESIQIPREMAGTLALGVLSTISQGKVQITPGGDYVEPTNLFIATVSASGERKTNGQRVFREPLDLFEREYNENQAMAIRTSEAKLRGLRAEVARAEKKLTSDNAPDTAVPDLVNAMEALDLYQPTKALRLSTDDATPEALFSLLAENSGAMAIFSAEPGVFRSMAGQYTGGVANYDIYLKGHAGDYARVDRKGREPEVIESPALTMVVGIQPSILMDIGKKKEMRGNGLLARFLFAVPKSRVGTRAVRTAPIPPNVRVGYVEVTKRLAADVRALREPVVLTLTNAARDAWDAFYGEIEAQLGLGGELYDLSDWASKLPGAVLRIAGLLHVARESVIGALQVSVDTMTAAIQIGGFYLAHAEIAFDLIAGRRNGSDARRLIEWASSNGLGAFSKSQARKTTAHRWDDDRLVDAMNMLCEYGLARVMSPEEALRITGQKLENSILLRKGALELS